MTISSLVIGEPRRFPLIGVIVKKTDVVYLNNNKYKRFEWTLNDGTGEIIVPFWNSLIKFNEYFNTFVIGDTISITNCGVDSILPKFSKGHTVQLKIVNKTLIVASSPIVDYTPFHMIKYYTELNVVASIDDKKYLWVRGVVSEIGDQKANLMDTGTRCDVKIRDIYDNILNVTIWGEHEIRMFDKLEICGRNREFMSLFQFSALFSDITIIGNDDDLNLKALHVNDNLFHESTVKVADAEENVLNTVDDKTVDDKAVDDKTVDGKIVEDKTVNRITGDGKTGDGKTGDGKTGDGKTGDGKTGDGKTGDGKTGDGKTGDGKLKEVDLSGNVAVISDGFHINQLEPNVNHYIENPRVCAMKIAAKRSSSDALNEERNDSSKQSRS